MVPCARPGDPRRPGWFIDRKLGEGGFGEVWVARHERTKELRVFKFCFDASRLTSFKRELTLFKLLREALGKREDIAGLLEVELDQSPFYLESEFVAGGNLHDWAVAEGRLVALPLEERLRLVAEIAKAVAAAHSVGIIHKDLKPSNVFMRQDADGRWHPMLADFGIGAVADRSQLERRGITVTGFTQSMLEPGSSRTGTRMYQPPEANLARPATVQGDVYALGVMLYQVVIGDFDQPLGIGWERRLEAARERGFWGVPDAKGEAPSESCADRRIPIRLRPASRRCTCSTPPVSWLFGSCGRTWGSAWTSIPLRGWRPRRNWSSGFSRWNSGLPPRWPAGKPRRRPGSRRRRLGDARKKSRSKRRRPAFGLSEPPSGRAASERPWLPPSRR